MSSELLRATLLRSLILRASRPSALPPNAQRHWSGRAGPPYIPRTSTTAEYSSLCVWLAPLQMPPDCLLNTAAAEWDTPSTSSAAQSARSRTISFSSFSSDGARAQMTPTSDMLQQWHLDRTLGSRCDLIRCRGRRRGHGPLALARAVAAPARATRSPHSSPGAARRHGAALGRAKCSCRQRLDRV